MFGVTRSNMEIISFLLTVAILAAANISPSQASLLVSVDIKVDKAVAEVNERYLSVTLDAGLIRHRWADWDFRSARLRTLATGLSPCYLRLGGTDADFMVFNPQESISNDLKRVKYQHLKVHNMQLDSCDGWEFCRPKNTTKFYMTKEDWDNINRFSVNVGWRMLFDFNVLLAQGSKWSPNNAKMLLQYTERMIYAHNIDFELGNEPNAFLHNFNRSLTGHQLGEDFLVLKDLMKNNNFSRSSLVGPDVTRPKSVHSKSVKFLKEFLPVAGPSINAITWHQYYINGRTAVEANFTDPSVLDVLTHQINVVQKVARKTKMRDKKVWLGETSSAWGGGAKGLSDSYVAGFMWLDKLGLAATLGIDIVMRQSFFRGHYALLDQDLEPRPDYWLSLLYKQLVGTRVLHVTVNDNTRKLRLYAHCTASPKQRLVPQYLPGSVTVYGMNLHDVDVTIPNLITEEVHQYLLLPHTSGKLQSHLVRLNNKKLKMIDDTTFPSLRPRILKRDKAVILPRKSFGFFVLPQAAAAACA